MSRRSLLLAFGFLAAIASAAAVLLITHARTSSGIPATTSKVSAPSSIRRQTAFPPAASLERARAFAARRQGRVSFGVVDTSDALACFRCHTTYHSASVVKAMLFVAYVDG